MVVLIPLEWYERIVIAKSVGKLWELTFNIPKSPSLYKPSASVPPSHGRLVVFKASQ